MTETQGELAALSRFIFTAPSWYSSLGFALVIAAFTGIAAFDSRFVLEDAWQGIFFIGIPTVFASVTTAWVDRRLGGNLTPNRSSLLALTSELLLVALVTGAGILAVLTPLGQDFVFDVLMAALASVFAFRLFVILAVSRDSLWIATIPASLQTLAGAVLLFVYSGTVRYYELGGGPIMDILLARPAKAPPELGVIGPGDFQLLALTCVLYAGAVYVFLVAIDIPWRNSLGVSVLDFLRGFVGHIAEGSRELEDFFEQLGEEAVVPVGILAFRRPDGTEKARFVLPMIHPGPMGDIGGGNLPERVARGAEGLAFPPHATAGHDFNLVTEREVDAIIETARQAHDSIDYSNTASVSVREQVGDAKVIGQAFGDGAFLTATYSPECADDVSYAVGLSAMAEAKRGGLDEVMLADAHNCNDGLQGGDIGHVVPGSRRSFDLIRAAEQVGAELAEAAAHPVRLGTAWDTTEWTPTEGIGPLGVRVAVLEAGDQRTGYVLVDGNNMEPGLREHIVDAVDGLDAVEVLTTDTHVVNTVDSTNQVGAAIPDDELVALIQMLVDEAIDDLEPVEAGVASDHAEVTVFGNDRTETLASHANAMIAMGAPLAAALIVAVAAVSMLIFLFA